MKKKINEIKNVDELFKSCAVLNYFIIIRSEKQKIDKNNSLFDEVDIYGIDYDEKKIVKFIGLFTYEQYISIKCDICLNKLQQLLFNGILRYLDISISKYKQKKSNEFI